MIIDKIENELKELILDDDFTSLQSLVNEEVNLMEILRISTKELQHSNFLAWLFNPNESHGLNDFALKEFIKIYFKENQFQNLGNTAGLSVFEFVEMDFDDLEIRREYKNIDLIFLSKKNQLCIVIENKIYSKEKKGQLQKYRGIIDLEYSHFRHKIFIYLSLNKQQLSEAEQDIYIQINYDKIIRLLEQVISNQKLKLPNKTYFVFEQYLQTLKSMLNQNEEIEKVAQQLYKKYKAAFDLVYKYSISSETNEIGSKLQELINHENTIRPFQSNKTYIRFQPNFLFELREKLIKVGFISQQEALESNWIFLFEFNVQSNQVTFDFKIGTGAPHIRTQLYEIYKKHKNFFTKVVKKSDTLSPQFHQAFQKEIISKESYRKYLEEETDIYDTLETKFNDLIQNDIKEIESILISEIEALIKVKSKAQKKI